MTHSSVAAIPMVPLLLLMGLLIFVVPVIIGIYVYRDAKKRGMNAILCTILAVLAPAFIGFIIYLIIRSEHSDLICPQCSKPISEKYIVCPSCGYALKNLCKKCDTPLEPYWINCPICGETISKEEQEKVQPKKVKDKSLGVILLLIIVVPILLVILLFVINISNMTKVEVSVGGMELYKSEVSENSYIINWMAECDKKGQGIYILKSVRDVDNGISTEFLIYQNNAKYDISYDISPSGQIFSPELKLKCSPLTDSDSEIAQNNYCLLFVETTYSEELKFSMEDENIKYDLSTTEKLIGIFLGYYSQDEYYTGLLVEIETIDSENTLGSLSVTSYIGEEAKETGVVDNMKGTSEAVFHLLADEDITSVEITAYDLKENKVYNGSFGVEDISEKLTFRLEYNADKKWVCTQKKN